MDLDLEDDPAFRRWRDHVVKNVLPKIRDSAVFVSLALEGAPDAKFCVELGMALMLDKPLVLVVRKGSAVPAKLRAVADRIVETDETATQDITEQLTDAIRSLLP